MAEYKGVMAYCEVAEGKLAAIATEGLGIGRKLADELGQELSAVLVGSGVSGLAQEAVTFGADKVYVVDDPLLKDYQTDSYVTVMEKVVKQVMPQVLIIGQTTMGGRRLRWTVLSWLLTPNQSDCCQPSPFMAAMLRGSSSVILTPRWLRLEPKL